MNSSTLRTWAWTGATFEPATGVPFTDRGFRYGMAIFESIAIRRGAEFLDEHIARLQLAAVKCGWPVDIDALAGAAALIQELPAPSFARIYITAGDGAPAAPVTFPRVFLLSEPRSSDLPNNYRVTLHPAPFLPAKPGIKTANYWPNIDAYTQARAYGCDEALLFNAAGELVSASMANVFAFIGGELITPPLSTGARPGVVREWVMRRQQVSERIISAGDLATASELILTSSWIGIMPVRALNDRPLTTRISENLRSEFFA